MSDRCDYDAIADRYEAPERAKDPDADLLAFVAEQRLTAPRVLDVGCGTGLQQTANRAALSGALLVGLDFSAGMLRIARGHGADVHWVRGDGPVLPFATGAFDYVSSQFAYQHMGGRVDALTSEVLRVLRPGGRFVMVNADPWGMRDWPVYTSFPEAEARDKLDFVEPEAFADTMRAAGFVDIDLERRPRAVEQSGREALDYAEQRHRTSQFLVIDDDAYAAGLARLRATVDPASTLGFVLGFVTIKGSKPR